MAAETAMTFYTETCTASPPRGEMSGKRLNNCVSLWAGHQLVITRHTIKEEGRGVARDQTVGLQRVCAMYNVIYIHTQPRRALRLKVKTSSKR